MTELAGGRRIWLGLAVFALLALAWHWRFTCDDAYISFRYARHLVEGQGLRFNPGEDPPVEGFSNLTWVLLLAPFEAAGVPLESAAAALSAGAGACLLALVARVLARRFPGQDAPQAWALMFLALQPALAVWASSGLETLPFACALFGLWERRELAPERRAGALAWALAALTLRVDGFAWALAVLAVQGWLGRTDRAAVRSAWQIALGLLAAFALLTLARWVYFGDVLPNTARIKAGLSLLRLERGAKYALSFLLAAPACALVPLAAWAVGGTRRTRILAGASALLVVHAVYAVYVGGDFMPMGRFFVAAMPFEALLLAHALAGRGRALQLALGGLACGLSLAAALGHEFAPRAWREGLHFRWNDAAAASESEQWAGMKARAQQWRLLGRALAAHTQPGESIVLGNIGAIGYESELVILDLFGLVDRDVARLAQPLRRASPGHDKGVGPEFFLARRPTYLAAWIERADAPLTNPLPASWTAAPGMPPLELVRFPLEAADGFERGSELRLVRLKWGS